MMQVHWPVLLSLWIATIVTVHCMAGLDCCLTEQAHDVLVHLRHHHHHQRDLVYASMQYSSCLHPWYYLVVCYASHCQFKWHHGCFSGRKGQAVYVQFLWRFSIAIWDSTFVSWEKQKMVSWINVRVYYHRAAISRVEKKVGLYLVLVVRPGDSHTSQLVHNQPVHVALTWPSSLSS